jgi:Thaumatin family
MTSRSLLSPILPHRQAGRSRERDLIFLALLTFGLSSTFQLVGTAPGHAQTPIDRCLQNLPKPTPKLHRVIQLVNCSYNTILGAAGAAGPLGGTKVPVLPREGTWVMAPFGSANNTNVLTIDIPAAWEVGTGNVDQVALPKPVFWPRTGCRYDPTTDNGSGFPKGRAQCETGDCGGLYDCSAGNATGKVGGKPPGTVVAEWTFFQAFPPPPQTAVYNQDAPDVSVVDGANLNMDIQPVGGSAQSPLDVPQGCGLGGSSPLCTNHVALWLAQNYPLTIHGQDLRTNCQANFAIMRSDLMAVQNARSVLRPVIVGGTTTDPVPQGGNYAVSCESNCGQYTFPLAPAQNCDPTTDRRCYLWKTFCDQQIPGQTPVYGGKCSTDADCDPVKTQNATCYIGRPDIAPTAGTCEPRMFVKNTACASNVCTFPYGFTDPLQKPPNVSWPQPKFGDCTIVTNAGPNPPANSTECIGDDTIHAVMPKGLVWPNDPETFFGDAPLYRIIFSPGGAPASAKITESTTPIPLCSTLPAATYNYDSPNGGNKALCAVDIANGAVFAAARPKAPLSTEAWSCNLNPNGTFADGGTGVVCRWK